jgi:dihydrofolate reductase
MRKLILTAHTSLDGFVAGSKGELDDFEAAAESLDFVNEICEKADAALFGRTSYELLNNYWPEAAKHPGVTKSEVNYSADEREPDRRLLDFHQCNHIWKRHSPFQRNEPKDQTQTVPNERISQGRIRIRI